MKELLLKSMEKGMDHESYLLLFKQLVAEGKTTGEPSPEKINFTKLNFSRNKRLDKTIELSKEQNKFFRDINKKQIWLVLLEPWCGDGAQSLPYFNKIAESSGNIDLKILLRDENLELMDSFLTNGSRSLPKLIILDENLELINHWGPRSKAATKVVDAYVEEHGKVDDQLKEKLQVWYNNNKGEAILQEIQELMLAEKHWEMI